MDVSLDCKDYVEYLGILNDNNPFSKKHTIFTRISATVV